MKIHPEIYKGLLAWTTAFSIVEPISILVSGDYHKPFVAVHVLANYLFYTIIFVKTMYIYKYFFKYDEFFPHKKITSKRISQFFAVFLVVQLVIDTSWAFMLKYLTPIFPILKIFTPFDRSMGLQLIINYVSVGMAMLTLTFGAHMYITDMEALSTILFSIFTIMLLAMPNSSRTLG